MNPYCEIPLVFKPAEEEPDLLRDIAPAIAFSFLNSLIASLNGCRTPACVLYTTKTSFIK
jgi:hypothetical protein